MRSTMMIKTMNDTMPGYVLPKKKY